MTLKEAATSLGLSPATLGIQIANRKLRATKRGRDWWVTPHEVERYRRESLSQRKGGPKPKPHGKRAPRAKLQVPQD